MEKCYKDAHGVVGLSLNDILEKHITNGMSEREKDMLVIFREFRSARVAKFLPNHATAWDFKMLEVLKGLCAKHNLEHILDEVTLSEGYKSDDGRFWTVTVE